MMWDLWKFAGFTGVAGVMGCTVRHHIRVFHLGCCMDSRLEINPYSIPNFFLPIFADFNSDSV